MPRVCPTTIGQVFQRSCFTKFHWHPNSTKSGLRTQGLLEKRVLATSRRSDAVETAPFVSLKTSRAFDEAVSVSRMASSKILSSVANNILIQSSDTF